MLFFFPLTVCRSSWSIFVLKQKLLLIPKNYVHIYICIMQMGVAEGWIYVLAEKPAGSSFRVFDPQANKWSMLPPIAGHSLQENWQGFACVAVGHKLILMGGRYVDTTTSMHHSSGSNLPQVLRVTSTIIHTLGSSCYLPNVTLDGWVGSWHCCELYPTLDIYNTRTSERPSIGFWLLDLCDICQRGSIWLLYFILSFFFPEEEFLSLYQCHILSASVFVEF